MPCCKTHWLSAAARSVGRTKSRHAARSLIFMCGFTVIVIGAQNLTETERSAAPKAPAVTMATGPCADAMP